MSRKYLRSQPDTVMALSGDVSGALIKGELLKPGNHGPLIYMNASPSVKKLAEKVEKAGWKIIQPSIKIPARHIAVIVDLEGNRIGIQWVYFVMCLQKSQPHQA